MTLEHFDSIFAFVVVIAGVSLLVTTLTQMVAALFGLRGMHLLWGIKTLLSSLDPNLTPHAEKIGSEVLHHPLISDSTFSTLGSKKEGAIAPLRRLLDRFLGRWKLASAIRKEELIRILTLLANPPPPAKPEAPAATRPENSATPAGDWQSALATALNRSAPQAARVLQLAAPEMRKLFPGDPAKADRIMARMISATGDLSTNVEQWFESVMDRVSQRFALHMRLWTVLFSFLVAFALHLDAFALFRQVSTDSELRARLVASADALSQKADEIITTTPTNAPAAVYVQAMRQLLAVHANELTNIPPPAGIFDLASGRRWLTDQLIAKNITNTAPWLEEYEVLVPGAKLTVAADNFRSLLNDKLKFQIVPDPYPGISSFWKPSWLHFWGTLASAALLSLGAPFWFNMLKTLSNLRPILANKQDKKAKAEKKS
jgi:hypothetical protein